MLEKLLTGPKTYYLWLLFLLAVIAGCGLVYLQQLQEGLSITGMSRDVSWGLYISQFTYLVGVAASAVMLVLPAYFHHYKKFKRMIIFGEFMAISAVVMCALFIVVDLGQPQRMMNVLLHPTPIGTVGRTRRNGGRNRNKSMDRNCHDRMTIGVRAARENRALCVPRVIRTGQPSLWTDERSGHAGPARGSGVAACRRAG